MPRVTDSPRRWESWPGGARLLQHDARRAFTRERRLLLVAPHHDQEHDERDQGAEQSCATTGTFPRAQLAPGAHRIMALLRPHLADRPVLARRRARPFPGGGLPRGGAADGALVVGEELAPFLVRYGRRLPRYAGRPSTELSRRTNGI